MKKGGNSQLKGKTIHEITLINTNHLVQLLGIVPVFNIAFVVRSFVRLVAGSVPEPHLPRVLPSQVLLNPSRR